ncbi:hypothetical protein BX264_6015 [Streptomyces sp. 2333.5]|uniref:hypothetical protein n=1 Tax=unclassified Streptomyces TaxID=2593676 RepID=UPI00089CBA7E|nr:MULTISPECIES: hypothetical protein [unclassified Streptomyces]PJJ05550.1 hypothetical protein BX264_6015 [Streptomyces sp. 2333.5]SEE78803.1 hypothetical protein SAMN05428943_6113 [Streptomyces sp. 2314.4]SEF00760.1 hypothetical protein SAMN05428942_6113 [Streptomyces sp. 2112.2]
MFELAAVVDEWKGAMRMAQADFTRAARCGRWGDDETRPAIEAAHERAIAAVPLA